MCSTVFDLNHALANWPGHAECQYASLFDVDPTIGGPDSSTGGSVDTYESCVVAEVFPYGGSQSCRRNVAPASITRIRGRGAPPNGDCSSGQVIPDSTVYRGCLIGMALPAGDCTREVIHKPFTKQSLMRLECMA